MDILSKIFGRFLSGYSLSKAILEDYAKVIAKLENVTEQEIINRVQKRNSEIFEQVKAEIQKDKETTEANQ